MTASFVVWHLAGEYWFVQIEVDHGAGTLLLCTMRWPLRSQVRTFPLVRVTDAVVQREADAVVQREHDGEDVRYMVFLVVEGEAAVPLVEGMWVSAKERHDKTAAAIRALLLPGARLA